MAHDGALTPRQRRAIGCLLTARNTAEAARAAGLGRRTLCTWLEQPRFVAALTAAESAAIDAATRQLVGLADLAIETLRTVLENPDATDGVRLRAAAHVLDHLLKLRELCTLERRIAALEAVLPGTGSTW